MASLVPSQMSQLSKEEYNALNGTTTNTPKFTLNKYSTWAKVVKVYDGDTIHVVFKYFGLYYSWNCRIAHVDTPELRTKNSEEKKLGYVVKEKVSELLLNKIVYINCFEFDKYGRLLVEVILPNSTEKLHEWLIRNNYANSYEGGTKEGWLKDKASNFSEKNEDNDD
jgi:endonuclease YncB( thermonuclease family)